MNNLVYKAALKNVQKKLDEQLNIGLAKIGDDFKPKEFYLKKWNYTLDEKRKSIDYWIWEQEKGKVHSPIK